MLRLEARHFDPPLTKRSSLSVLPEGERLAAASFQCVSVSELGYKP